jgi:putative addiction module CopG family antidote
MNVSLTPQLEEMISKKVATGMYHSASEVVREALRLMGERDESRQRQLEQEPEYSDEQFYADVRKSSKQLDAMESKALEEHAQGKTRKFPA